MNSFGTSKKGMKRDSSNEEKEMTLLPRKKGKRDDGKRVSPWGVVGWVGEQGGGAATKRKREEQAGYYLFTLQGEEKREADQNPLFGKLSPADKFTKFSAVPGGKRR